MMYVFTNINLLLSYGANYILYIHFVYVLWWVPFFFSRFWHTFCFYTPSLDHVVFFFFFSITFYISFHSKAITRQYVEAIGQFFYTGHIQPGLYSETLEDLFNQPIKYYCIYLFFFCRNIRYLFAVQPNLQDLDIGYTNVYR